MSLESTNRILLADLSHLKTGSEWSVLPMPINMGYLASFVQAYASHPLDIRICKIPHEFIQLVLDFEPHVVAFSNYIWNANLVATAAEWVRRVRPETLIVMGSRHHVGLRLHLRTRIAHRDAQPALAKHQNVVRHIADRGNPLARDRKQLR